MAVEIAPFKTLREPEIIDVCGLRLPKRGCLTVAEEEAIRNFGATIPQELENLTQPQADLAIKKGVVAILLKSRVDRTWTAEKTNAETWEFQIGGQGYQIEPDMILLDALYEFFMNEQRRWKSDAELEPVEDNGTKKKLTGSKSSGS